jgi:hypothetical protein
MSLRRVWFLLAAAAALCPAALLPRDAGATATYYFSTSGSDSNDGLSPASPKQSLGLIPNLINGSGGDGNRALLKRGDVWHTFDLVWDFSGKSGSPASPMLIGAYGDTSVSRPVVSTLVRNDSSEFQVEPGMANVFSVAQRGNPTPTDDRVFRLYLGGAVLPKVPSIAALTESTYAVAGGRIYVKASGFTSAIYVESMQYSPVYKFIYGLNAHYLTIEDLEVRGSAGSSPSLAAVAIFHAPDSHITLRNLFVLQFRHYGIVFGRLLPPNTTDQIADVTVENCFVDKGWSTAMNGEYRFTVQGDSSGGANGGQPGGDGIAFGEPVVGAVVRGCFVTNMGHSGIGAGYGDGSEVALGTRNILIEQNVVTSGSSSYCRAIGVGGPGSPHVANNVIRRNYLYDSNIQSQFGGDSNYVYSNIFDSTLPTTVSPASAAVNAGLIKYDYLGTADAVIRNWVFANNTFLNADAMMNIQNGIVWTNDGYLMHGNVFANNLCVNWREIEVGAAQISTAMVADTTYISDPATGDHWQFQNNGFWKSTGGTIVMVVKRAGSTVDSYDVNLLNARSNGAGNVYGDPQFVGGSGRSPDNFRLAATSPYLASGVNLASLLPPGMPAVDFYGTPFACTPSLGAIQYSNDVVAPGTTTDLRIASYTTNPKAVKLKWTAPGDDGSCGMAASYSVRKRKGAAITEANWSTSTVVSGTPAPSASGSTDSVTAGGLSGGTWYFALKTSDEAGNSSALSNNACIQFSNPPVICGGGGAAAVPAREEEAPALALAITEVSPNPASQGGTEVSFALAEASPATLEVFDIAGRQVEARDLSAFGPGTHRVRIGAALSSGYYWVRIRQGGRTASHAAIIVR